MLVTVQFPLADLRPFVADPTYRLLTPDWPTPRAGPISCASSDKFAIACSPESKNGRASTSSATLRGRFDSTHFSIQKVSDTRRRYGAFRQFFSDGEGLARIEVGLGFRGKQPWSLTEFLAAVARLGLASCVDRPVRAGGQDAAPGGRSGAGETDTACDDEQQKAPVTVSSRARGG